MPISKPRELLIEIQCRRGTDLNVKIFMPTKRSANKNLSICLARPFYCGIVGKPNVNARICENVIVMSAKRYNQITIMITNQNRAGRHIYPRRCMQAILPPVSINDNALRKRPERRVKPNWIERLKR